MARASLASKKRKELQDGMQGLSVQDASSMEVDDAGGFVVSDASVNASQNPAATSPLSDGPLPLEAATAGASSGGSSFEEMLVSSPILKALKQEPKK